MGFLLKFLLSSGQQKSQKKDSHLEREMNRHGLFENEKKLVRSNKYDSWNFDEDEMDEDDYYHDDN